MNFIKALNLRLNKVSLQIAGFFLIAMILISCGNVFLRIVWMPIKGTYELLGFFSAMAAAMALGYTQIKRAHVAVDILTTRLPKKTSKVIDGFSCLVGCLFFIISGWQVFECAEILRETGEVTETLRVIYYPFTYVMSLGFFLLSLALFVQFLTLFDTKEGEK
jgi:TRAP-type C4-dicarboxylate transport system permease small subunit